MIYFKHLKQRNLFVQTISENRHVCFMFAWHMYWIISSTPLSPSLIHYTVWRTKRVVKQSRRQQNKLLRVSWGLFLNFVTQTPARCRTLYETEIAIYQRTYGRKRANISFVNHVLKAATNVIRITVVMRRRRRVKANVTGRRHAGMSPFQFVFDSYTLIFPVNLHSKWMYVWWAGTTFPFVWTGICCYIQILALVKLRLAQYFESICFCGRSK